MDFGTERDAAAAIGRLEHPAVAARRPAGAEAAARAPEA
eukprot:SAG11_NODE_19181_length_472_cov_1.195710_1_plen_38_part_10